MPENQITVNIGTKLNNFAGLLGLNSFGSDGNVIQKLQSISKKEIQAIMIICPPSNVCSDIKCQGHAILQQSDPATTTLIKSSVFLSGKCSNCKTHYFADHENYPQVGGHWWQVYLNNAKYLKLGKSLYVNIVEKVWSPCGKSMESMWKNHGIHPQFHRIHLEFWQSTPPSLVFTWNNLGRVKYWFNFSFPTQPYFISISFLPGLSFHCPPSIISFQFHSYLDFHFISC